MNESSEHADSSTLFLCQVQIETLLMALVRDVSACVSDAYITAVDMVFGVFCKLLMLIGAMVFLQIYSGTFKMAVEPMLPLIAICALPLPILGFLALRQQKCFKLRAAQFKEENSGIDHVITSKVPPTPKPLM